MKEKYIKPNFELEEFKQTDVLTTSQTSGNGDPDLNSGDEYNFPG